MEASSEIKNQYAALALTTVFHLALFSLFFWIVFNGSEHLIHNGQQKEIPVLTADVNGYDLNSLEQSAEPKSANTEKLLIDPSEKVTVNHVGPNNNSNSVFIKSEEHQMSDELKASLLKIHSMKKKGSGDESKIAATGINSFVADPSESSIPDGSIELAGRKVVQKPEMLTDANEEGTVVVAIIVDENGKVINAIPGQRGSTTTSSSLFAKASGAAYKTRFNKSPDGAVEQRGTYTFVFTLE
jgi:hypothetical protein